MNIVWEELTRDLHGQTSLASAAIRLLLAALLASIVGVQRERTHKAAGLRTHLLVALGSALFTMISLAIGDPTGHLGGDATRVIQGIATGIGFIGGGVILKLPERKQVKGLTTAASIWLVAAVGVAAGAGHYLIGLAATLLSWFVLVVLAPLDLRLDPPHAKTSDNDIDESPTQMSK